MAWIEVHQGLRTHPKVRKLAKALDCDRNQAIGILTCLWLWAVDHKGKVDGCASEDISDACLWRGDSDQLVTSLKKTGWIDKNGEIHDWSQYGDKLLRKSRDRQAKYRKDNE
ncbi:hypothetical protein LCGC14_2928590 [marine sediment metagenome]|uniref:Bacteriophage lambda Replication protein O N-terminal domain-containing protein n=1 Tax=marine sediment metagenome TaxID=412755 RepID=A0A0F9ACQ4_9ZZZZ